MTDPLADEDRLFEEAVDILIRIQNDPDNPVGVEMATRWLARGELHQKIWAEALEIHGMTANVLTRRRREERRRAYQVSRRTLVFAGLAATGGIVVAGLAAPQLMLEARADVLTSRAEVRRIVLADGSSATLGPDSALASRMTASHRDVDLLQGMAFFEVTHDPHRPFTVHLDDMKVHAVGTAFDVSDDDGAVNVAVSHGEVKVDPPPRFRQPSLDLFPGQWLSLVKADGNVTTGTKDVGQIASWRDGMIVVERETIASVVSRVARWTSGRVVIASSQLAGQPVSGVYDLRQPLLALEAIVQPYGGKVRAIGPYLTVISAI